MACAAERAWYLNRWDDFMIPKPFSRVALAVGVPVVVPKMAGNEDMENYRLQMERAINELSETASAALADSKS